MKLFTPPAKTRIKRISIQLGWGIFNLVVFSVILISCSTDKKVEVEKSITNIKTIRVVMDNNYPPYAFLDKDGNMQGITVDQWKLWEKYTGVQVEIVGLPWDQAINRMKNGEFDVIDTLFYTEERDKVFDFTEPYANIDVLIFFPNNVSGIATVNELRGFRVAVKTGDANADYLLRHEVNKLFYYDSYEEIIQAAARKDEAIFVIDGPPALYFLYKYEIQKNFNYSEPLYGGEFHRAVAEGNTALLELLKDGFLAISTEEYQSINDYWFGKQYPKNLDRIISYLATGIVTAMMIILILISFNRSLQSRVKSRTKELQKSEELFRDSIEFMPIPISVANANDHVLVVNKKFVETYGYTLEKIPLVSKWLELAYPNVEYYKQVVEQWNQDVVNATEKEIPTPLREYEVTDVNGEKHTVEITMRPVKDLWISSFVDVTEHKKIERKLEESKTRYRAIFEDSPIPLLEEDFSALKTYLEKLQETGVQDFEEYFKNHPHEIEKCLELVKIVDANQTAVKWYGYENKERLQVKLSELLNPNEKQSFLEELLALIKGNMRYEISISRTARNGEPLHLILSGSVIPECEKTWARVLVSIQDVTELKKVEEDLEIAYDTTLEGWAKALELKDKETEGHSRRVTNTTLIIAEFMGFKEKELTDIRRGTILHDIGKMSIPDEILRKNGLLNEEEKIIIQRHPQVAYDLLKNIPHLKNAIEIPYNHHEKWDGTGYPRKLKGEEIPLTARIFAIVDVWDALSYDRPYRNAWSKDKIVDYLKQEAGKHFDPKIVNIFLELLEKGEI